MASLMEIMQLCRLCLVKDQVNIPIFEEQGDIRQIFLKISACLPVKVSREDNLPKKICDGCSYKLEILYQFWNTSANSEKQLLKWLSQIGVEKNSTEKVAVTPAQPHSSLNSDGVVLKQEIVDLADTHSVEELAPDDLDDSNDAQDYILQQQQLPYQPFQFQQDGFTDGEATASASTASATITSETVEAAPKRKRRAAAMKALPPHIDSEEEDEDDVDMVETKIAKTEEQSDDSGAEDPEPTAFVGLPSTSTDNEQPGPSGVGKGSTEAPEPVRKLIPRGIADKTKLNQSNTEGQAGPGPNNNNNNEEPFCVMQKNKNLVDNNLPKKYYIPITHCTVENSRQYNILLPVDKKLIEKDSDTVILLPPVPLLSDQETKENNGDTKNQTVTLKFVNVQAHTDIPNSKNFKYKCDICSERFCFPNLYKDHMNLHQNVKPYKCNKCNSVFSTMYLHNKHKSFHNATSKLELCKQCGHYFKRLASHIQRAHKLITCTHCGVEVKDLEHHIKIKHQFNCDECHFSCTNQTELKSHNEVHCAKYQCVPCGVSYFSPMALKSHQLAHTTTK